MTAPMKTDNSRHEPMMVSQRAAKGFPAFWVPDFYIKELREHRATGEATDNPHLYTAALAYAQIATLHAATRLAEIVREHRQ